MKVYISGQITGLEVSVARGIFAHAEKELIARGFTPVNPLKNGLPYESSWEDHMKRDIQLLLDCDLIYMFPNFRQSKGAMLELYIAKKLGIHVLVGIVEGYSLVDAIIDEPYLTHLQALNDRLKNNE